MTPSNWEITPIDETKVELAFNGGGNFPKVIFCSPEHLKELYEVLKDIYE